MYRQRELRLEDRLELFSRYWREGADHGAVSRLAGEWRVSRKFIYRLAQRVREAVDWQRPGRKAVDRSREEAERLLGRVAHLEADVETLRGELEIERRDRADRRFRLLLEIALSPVSEDKVARCLGAAYGREPSSGWVHAQIERAGEAALRLMRRREVREALVVAALDELFSGRAPILMVVDPTSMLALVPESVGNRQGETWGKVLAQYPNLRLAISDLGSGLLKGVELRGGIDHQADLFHFKRAVRREVRRIEGRCYEAIASVDAARKQIGRPRLLSSARVQAEVEWREKQGALDRQLLAFDWAEVIVGYVDELTEPFDRLALRLRRYEDAQRALDDALELLAGIEEVDVDGMRTTIDGARDSLFTFLRVLEVRLTGIDVRWQGVEGSREALFSAVAWVWHQRQRASTSKREWWRYVRALTGLAFWDRRTENLAEVVGEVFAALEAVVRASSAVECLNSVVRPYTSVKKRLNQRYLALVAFYWNCHPIPGRGKRTPFQESGVDLGSDDWVELLEREIRAAAPLAPPAH